MKKISVVIPCYNEADNAARMCEALLELFRNELSDFAFELVFIDNHSTDGTREILRKLCQEHAQVKAIFNVRNVGVFNSSTYALLQVDGDCAVSIACDFQDPVELIPQFVEKWSAGAEVVAGVQSGSRENRFVYGMRSLFYKLLRAGSPLDHLEHFTGFGLYDRRFLEKLRSLDDPAPFLRGIVAELSSSVEKVTYEQPKRKRGKSGNRFFELYDAAMLSFTSYTSMGLRVMTICGFFVGLVSVIIGLAYLIYKLTHWYRFDAGMAPVLIGMFFLGAVVLVSVGMIGEYVISINRRLMHRPLVIEEERIGDWEPKELGS